MKMMLTCGVSDAYGAGFEFNEAAYIANRNDLKWYVTHHGHPGLYPGMYTDDTQMSIALAELMLEDEAEWTHLKIANKFVECFKRDERQGYAGRFYWFLKSIGSGKEFLDKIMPISDKSGSAMRVAVVGLYPSLIEVEQKTYMQASVTHMTEDGIAAAMAVAFTAHYFHYDIGPKKELLSWLASKINHFWKHPYAEWQGKAGVKGVQCVRAAHTAIMEHNKLSDILKASVAFSGDVDTVAAISMSCACLCKEIEQDLPEQLIHGLENKTYGKDYLQVLDKKLSEKFNPCQDTNSQEC